ncbi:LytR C-terminal domain-containing protein [Prauserella muralis]|uniref:Uncharacterized protein n=1 Tax=Prauserella muralis TaxID=588067 RepID=A0A2V4B7C1_9PSEU|nr:LytR C-terminal domain-containing protein [Prauserella muralis]PXY31021.1 hypothetical protein BAY60_00925 [Prauserella muralis]TWE14709.1 LytR cell envelope-related transcriptional attenuator [Prauserella muralis]
MSVFDGLSRPMRAAGLGLLAVAVIAAVIGGITLATGNGDGDQNASPTPTGTAQPTQGPGGTTEPSATSSPGSPTNGQPSSPGSPTRSPGGTGTPAPGQGDGTGDGNGNGDAGDGQAGDGDGDGANGQDQQASAKWVAVRVYNNSTIKGLASEAAEDFRSQGWNVVDVSNYSSGVIPTSTAYFRPGTAEETAARSLAGMFGLRAEPRFEGIADSSAGVIVIVTKDYQGVSKGK